jgi:mycothiol synthase
METIDIREIDGMKASDRDLAAINDLWEEVYREYYPDDPPRPAAELIARFRSEPSYQRARIWAARDADGSVVGTSELWWQEKEENRHRAHIAADVHPRLLRRGLATKLLVPAAEKAREMERSLLSAYVIADSPGGSFLRALGFERAKTKGEESEFGGLESRLSLEELDRTLIETWIERAPERASDYELLFWDGLTPDEHLERYAALVNVMNTAPMDENYEDENWTPERVREYEVRSVDAGHQIWTYVARHVPTGEFAGNTRIFPNPFRKVFAHQEDTAVAVEHRNQGLGRWLKAAMLEKLMTERPETRWVITWNATMNDAMLSINLALGFTPFLTWDNWQIATDDLSRRLEERSG